MRRTSPEQKWALWSAYFDDVQREMISLFHTRWMWRTILDLTASSGVTQYTVVQNYLIRTYVATVCTAIRREVDSDARTTSLARCLHRLVDAPDTMTRARYAEIVRAACEPEHAERLAREGFDRFAPGGGEVLEVDLILASIARIRDAAEPVKKYTDEVLAHRQRANGNVVAVAPSFDDINHALDELGEVTKQYFALRHPTQMLAALTPIVDYTFLNMFKEPWYTEGHHISRELDLG